MKPHRTDNVSLFFGLLFVVIAGAFMISRTLDVDLPPIGWFIAGAAVVFGVLGIASALFPQRKEAAVGAEPATAPAPAEPDDK